MWKSILEEEPKIEIIDPTEDQLRYYNNFISWNPDKENIPFGDKDLYYNPIKKLYFPQNIYSDFEFEYLYHDKWYVCSNFFQCKLIRHLKVEDAEEEFYNHCTYNRIRIKYLTIQDIENLGYVHTTTVDKVKIYHFKYLYFKLIKNIDEIFIYRHDDLIYQTHVNNKNELKQILNMVNYY